MVLVWLQETRKGIKVYIMHGVPKVSGGPSSLFLSFDLLTLEVFVVFQIPRGGIPVFSSHVRREFVRQKTENSLPLTTYHIPPTPTGNKAAVGFVIFHILFQNLSRHEFNSTLL